MSELKNKWTPELEKEAESLYVDFLEAYPEEERASMSPEAVKYVALEVKMPSNAVRMRLSKLGVYLEGVSVGKKATQVAGEVKTGTRTSKADAQGELVSAFTDAGISKEAIDMGIVEKLTGKAAAHLSALVRQITK